MGEPVFITLRVEGPISTIFEGRVKASGNKVRTRSDPTLRSCNGGRCGNEEGPTGNTITSTLNDAIKGEWDGKYYPKPPLCDFLITEIAGFRADYPYSWGLFLNGARTEKGGCRTLVQEGDKVLVAYGLFSPPPLLKATATPPDPIKVGEELVVTVVNGLGKETSPVRGVAVAWKRTDGLGQVKLKFDQPGEYRLKASKEGMIRSNELRITVVA